MMFHFPSFVIDDNYELAKVVNELCIFCMNIDYERNASSLNMLLYEISSSILDPFGKLIIY